MSSSRRARHIFDANDTLTAGFGSTFIACCLPIQTDSNRCLAHLSLVWGACCLEGVIHTWTYLAPFSFASAASITMAGETNGEKNGAGMASETGALTGTMRVKAGLAQMLKGGVIMGESVKSASQLFYSGLCGGRRGRQTSKRPSPSQKLCVFGALSLLVLSDWLYLLKVCPVASSARWRQSATTAALSWCWLAGGC